MYKLDRSRSRVVHSNSVTMTADMTIDETIRAARERPGWFEKYADDLYAEFDTAPPATRAEITELLKYIADFVPQLVAEHTDLLAAGLRDPHPSVCQGAIYAVAAITRNHVEMVKTLVPELLAALATAERRDVRATAVQALATIGNDTEISVSEGDELFASLLREGDELLRNETARNMAINVMDTPDEYPHLLRAYIDSFTDSVAEVRESAMKTLAVVARDYPTAIPDIKNVVFQLKQFRWDDDLEKDDVERAIGMLQEARDEMPG
jgi:hypothetical protein